MTKSLKRENKRDTIENDKSRKYKCFLSFYTYTVDQFGDFFYHFERLANMGHRTWDMNIIL